jgi:glycosyltransferase involved in cell wall biosynthesis
MKILVNSIIDLRKTAPNRLHHFMRYLSRKHEIRAICINDWWRAELLDTEIYNNNFNDVLDGIQIDYITGEKISPFKQEFSSPRLINLEGIDSDIVLNYNTLISGYHTAKSLGLPMVYDIADDLPGMIATSPQIPRILRPVGKYTGNRMLRRSLRIASKITGTSKTIQRSCSVPDSKFELLPNGVDTALFRREDNDLKNELGLEDNFVMGYVGVLREWIDLDMAYQAIKRLENARLLIVGEEGRFKKTKEDAYEMGIGDKVVFTGTVPYHDVPKYICAMDACLIPFKRNDVTQNASPLKLLEYMACEKPVISTRLEGVKEVAGDIVLYADSAEEMISHAKMLESLDVGKELGNKGRQLVLDKYGWDSITRKLDEVLEGAFDTN